MVVEIILPKRTFERTTYRLVNPMKLAGIEVPAGFVSDGASVPRLLWWLFPPVGRYFRAAVLHDYLLSINFGWRSANRYFRRGLEEQGVAAWVVFSMFWAVQGYQWFKHLIKY